MDIDELLREAYSKSLCDIEVEYDGESSRIKFGELQLKCHTYGEYIVDAYPDSILSRYAIGDQYSLVESYLKDNPGKSDDELVSMMKQDRKLNMMTDHSIRELMKYCRDDLDKWKSDTEVTQYFNEDGTEIITIENDDWLFDINDDFRYSNKVPDKYVSFTAKYNPDTYLKKCEARVKNAEKTEELINRRGRNILKKGKENLAGKIDKNDKGRLSLVKALTYGNLQKTRTKMDNAYHTDYLFEEILESKYLLDCLSDNIDQNANIFFLDKHFVTTGFEEDEEPAADQISRRGGIFHSGIVKATDYLIVELDSYGESKVRKALELKDRGSDIQIITSAQFEKALFDKSIPVLSEEELQALAEEREKKKQLEVQEKLEMKQREEEEKAARKQKRMEERRERLAAQQEAREKKAQKRAEIAEEKRLAEQEKERIKHEAREQKEAEKKETQRLVDEKREQRETAIEEARANAIILYAPGEEPERLHNRIQTLMAKLDEAYPDHVIVNLGKDHKHWDETVTELYKALGYADRASFFEAYGFKANSDKGGRPTTLNPKAVIEELKKRYPDGTDLKMSDLMAANKDLPLKTLQNQATQLLGMGLGTYLKQIGVMK